MIGQNIGGIWIVASIDDKMLATGYIHVRRLPRAMAEIASRTKHLDNRGLCLAVRARSGTRGERSMLLREDLLAIGKRNVERAQELVYRQRAVVRGRRQAGLETDVTEDVLRLFERLLGKFEDDLARLTPDIEPNANVGLVEPMTVATAAVNRAAWT
jgi:hypothetical protein